MKQRLAILMFAVLLPVAAFAAHKKESQPSGDPSQWQYPEDAQEAQDATDWLNAPTPDGSPTLKQTSDWLAKALNEYGGFENVFLRHAHIDNSCNFYYTYINERNDGEYSPWEQFSVPLGAITDWVTSGALITFKTGDLALVRTSNLSFAAGNKLQYRDKSYHNFGQISMGQTPAATAGAAMPQSPEEFAPRIAKALQHAVDLCRATYKPSGQAKEPF